MCLTKKLLLFYFVYKLASEALKSSIFLQIFCYILQNNVKLGTNLKTLHDLKSIEKHFYVNERFSNSLKEAQFPLFSQIIFYLLKAFLTYLNISPLHYIPTNSNI